jgi:NDP-sugar pyrophosphorylase family protein
MHTKDIAIVYMVAGMSSRFGGKIKQFAKVGINGETLMEYSMNQALKAGFTKIVFIVGKLTEAPFKEKFGNSFEGTPILYAHQTFDPIYRDKPWGTVDAICSISNIVNCPFVVCNGDDIYGEKTFQTLVNHIIDGKNSEASVGYHLSEVLPEKGSTNRGIFEVDETHHIVKIEEKFNIVKHNLQESNLKGKELCSMNIFALHPETLHKLNRILFEFKLKHKEDRKKECLLPVELSTLIEKKEISMKLYPSEEKWLGVTNPEDEEIVKNQILEIEQNRK